MKGCGKKVYRNTYPMRIEYNTMVDPLQRSLYANAWVCAMSSQLFHIEETRDLKGNKQMHEHLVPASYHRVTALGSAIRLQSGESDASIIETLTACIQNSKEADAKVRKYLMVMLEAAPENYQTFIQQIMKWQDLSERYLAEADAVLRRLGITVAGTSEQHSRPHQSAARIHPPMWVFQQIAPVLQHTLKEINVVSPEHALTEGVYIAYLMGRGYDYPAALRIVESWESNEYLPGQYDYM